MKTETWITVNNSLSALEPCLIHHTVKRYEKFAKGIKRPNSMGRSNSHDKPAGRKEQPDATYRNRLSPDEVYDIRERGDRGDDIASICALYRLSRDYVTRIVNRKKWANLPER